MTNFERRVLANQYEILKHVHPSNAAHYDVLIKMLFDGYLHEFDLEAGQFQEELSESVRTEVRDILEMFRALTPRGEPLNGLHFAGFDGNEETEHYAYASFMLEDLGRWRESAGAEMNSHCPMLRDYRAMLRIWRGAADPQCLTPEELAAITEAAPYLAR